jgi:hypothetical protein
VAKQGRRGASSPLGFIGHFHWASFPKSRPRTAATLKKLATVLKLTVDDLI